MSSRLAPMRPFWLLLPLGLLYLASLVRLIDLQVVEAAERGPRALFHKVKTQQVDPPRGRLLDRNDVVLSTDRPSWQLVMDAPLNTRRELSEEDIAPMAELLGLSAAEVGKLCRASQVRSVIAAGLSPEAAQQLSHHLSPPSRLAGSGLALEKHWERFYPQGRTFSHVVGRVLTEREGRSGVGGMERFCDALLQGEEGYIERRRVGPSHGIDPVLLIEPSRCGEDVRTTLDARLGFIIREEVAGLTAEWEPDWVAVVVLDPRNGDLLGLASLPDYDPNHILPEELDNLLFTPVGCPVEPGSTAKPFVIGLALAEGTLTTTETIFGENGVWYDGRRRIEDSHPVGNVTAREILVHSSNISAAKVGKKLGWERLQEGLESFGIEEPLHLLSNEARQGRLPSEALWKNAYTVPSVSFGHQFQVTPARLVYSFASTINGGLLYPPRVLAGAPGEAPRRVLPDWVSAFLRDALVGVVEEGSGIRLPSREGVRWGGKSGTTKKTHEVGYTSSFIGFAPAEDPELLVAVVVENPSRDHYGRTPYGRTVAGPVVGRILLRGLMLRGSLPPE